MFKKQIFLALCLSCISFFMNAQDSTKTSTETYLDKGTWLLGGNLSYLNVTTTCNNPNSGGFGGQFGGTGGLGTGGGFGSGEIGRAHV